MSMLRKKWEEARLLYSLVDVSSVNFSEAARKTGLNYWLVRSRVLRLIKKGYLRITPTISVQIAGNVVAIVRVKNGETGYLTEFSNKCNKVIAGIQLNGNEYTLIIHGRSKEEIMKVVEIVKKYTNSGGGIEIEFGKLPPDFYVPVKTDPSRCPYSDCYQDCLAK